MSAGTAPVRLQLSRAAGFDLQRESWAVNARPAVACHRGGGRLGNPFTKREHGRERAVELHRLWLAGASPATLGIPDHDAMLADFNRRFVLGRLPALRGRNLACFCPLPRPGEPDVCHCVELLARANPIDVPQAAHG